MDMTSDLLDAVEIVADFYRLTWPTVDWETGQTDSGLPYLTFLLSAPFGAAFPTLAPSPEGWTFVGLLGGEFSGVSPVAAMVSVAEAHHQDISRISLRVSLLACRSDVLTPCYVPAY